MAITPPNDGGSTLPQDSSGQYYLGLWEPVHQQFWSPQADVNKNMLVAATDGSIAAFGLKADAAWNGSDSAPSIQAILKALYNQTVQPVTHFLGVSVALSTTGTLVAAITSPNKSIVVIGYALTASAATTLQWQDSSTNLSGVMNLAAGVPLIAWGSPTSPVLSTNSGSALKMTTGSGAAVTGHLVYITV